MHTFYALTALSPPPLLSFLPGFIYLLGGLVLARWSKKLQSNHLPCGKFSIRRSIVFGLGALLLVIGGLFCVVGLQQMHIFQ